MEQESRDLTNISFNDFVSLIFDRSERFKPDAPLAVVEIDERNSAITTCDCFGNQNSCSRDLQNKS